VNVSSVHNSEIESSVAVKLAVDMGTRDEIMARLRQLPAILDKTDAEIAEACGITPQMWSNYKSEGASENVIRPMVALELWNAYGIPMEWVYDAQTARADSELRAKLAKANREAEAWLAARRPKPGRGPKAHIAIIMIAGAFLFASYAPSRPSWKTYP
jgi:transcriptional regulator with XRE-family HTH domain